MSLRLAGKLFHNNAAAFGKQRSPYVFVLERGTVSVNVDCDRSARAAHVFCSRCILLVTDAGKPYSTALQ